MSKKMINMLRQFGSAQSGNVGVFAAMLTIPFGIAAGASIDMARLNTANTLLRSAVDNAVLAGTQSLFESSATQSVAHQAALTVANNYFDHAISQSGLIDSDNIVFSINSEGTGVNSTGIAKVKPSLLSFAGVTELSINGKSGANAEQAGPQGDLEVSVMLDVTGSMCNSGSTCTTGTKIEAMKTAARNLVDKVVWDDQSVYTSKVTIVPFSTHVRIGPNAGGVTRMAALTGLPATWSGYVRRLVTAATSTKAAVYAYDWTASQKVIPCVTERYYSSNSSFSANDDAPGSGKFANAFNGTRRLLGNDSSATAYTGNTGATTATYVTSVPSNFSSTGTCSTSHANNEIMPLTNDKTALKSKITSLVAAGGTSGALGTQFSWYAISPNWSSIWTGSSAPQPYAKMAELGPTGKPKLRKVVILMTDGEYNQSLGGNGGANATTISSNAVTICNAMKAKNIEVYAVGFELDSLSSTSRTLATTTLQGCGTDVGHFYDSIDGDKLNAAFKAIGNSVSNSEIRLTN